MSELLLLFVLGAGVVLGMAIATTIVHRRLDQLVNQMQQDDVQLRELLDRELRPSGDVPASLAQLDQEDRIGKVRDDGPQEHLEQVRAPGSHASNDRLAHALDVPGIIRKRPASTRKPSTGFFSSQRPCAFCDRVRALFTR